MADIVSLGAARTGNSSDGFVVPVAAVRRDIDYEGGVSEDLCELKIACCLGVTALPAAADDATGDGAEGLAIGGSGGEVGHVVAAWDVRAADVAGEMSPGDSCLHGTHEDATKRARFFAKEDLAAIIVGNDLALTLDRGEEAVTLAAFGHVVQIDGDQILIAHKSGGNWIRLGDGVNNIVGATTIGGGTAGPVVKSAELVTALGALATAFSGMGSWDGATASTAITALATAVGATASTTGLLAT